VTGRSEGRLLDLGSSYGNTAAAFALTGWDVVGVELSDRIKTSPRSTCRQ
jgi:SAM-dependent methyltransferase